MPHLPLSAPLSVSLIPTQPNRTPLDPIPQTLTHRIKLGPIGREGEEKLHQNINSYIPVIVALVEEGVVKPNEVQILGRGLEELVGVLGKGAGGGKKGVVLVGRE